MTDKVQLIKQEIERQIKEGKFKCQQSQENNDYESFVAWSEHIATCGKLLVFIDSLPEETKPRFPNYERVVDKVFGAGNLDSWEYEEAEKLVLLAKEELLKDLEINKEPASEDLEEEIERCWKEMFPIGWSDYTLLTLTYEQHKAFAHHFAEWQKQQMMKDAIECIVHQCEVMGIKLDGVEILSDGLILDEKIFKDGDKVKIIIIKEE